jgi:hypothetical protein
MRRTIAQHYAWAGLWEEAAALYGPLVLQQGATEDEYYRAGCMALRAGDAAAYRRVVAQWVDQVGDSDELGRLYFLTWLASLGANSGVEPLQALQWTRKGTGKNLLFKWWRC